MMNEEDVTKPATSSDKASADQHAAPGRFNTFVRLDAVQRFLRQRAAVAGLIFLIVVTLLAIFAPMISPYPFDKGDLSVALNGPSGSHWLGTDDVGRDILSRMLYGGRTTLMACLQATVFAVVLGVPTGILAGYFKGVVDAVLSRIADALMTFPALLLAVVIIGIIGPGLGNAMIAIGVVYAPRLFRVTRASVVNIAGEVYVNAAKTIGCTQLRVLARHIFPNALSPVLVQITLTMGTAALAEASLSFLGLGVQPPQGSWGSILGRAVPTMTQQPAAVIASGVAILLLVLAFNVVGDGIRDSIGRERRG